MLCLTYWHLRLAAASAIALLALAQQAASSASSDNDTLCLSGGTPFMLADYYLCPPGFFCPNMSPTDNLTFPQMCPPTTACASNRLASSYCDPQGIYEPEACPTGFHCPQPTEKIICPVGYYCPRGTVNPYQCDPISNCTKGGMVFQNRYLGIVITVIIDVVLVAICLRIRFANGGAEDLMVIKGIKWLAGRAQRGYLHLRHTILASSSNAPSNPSSASSPSSPASSNPAHQLHQTHQQASEGAPSEELASVVSLNNISHSDSKRITPLPYAAAGMHGNNNSNSLSDSDESALEINFSGSEEEDALNINIDKLKAAFQRANGSDLVMNLDFDSLSYTLPSGKTILSGVTGSIRAGTVTAIMGPSGAGKTTFLHTLMGKIDRTSGDLLINGEPGEIYSLRKIIGYVPQEDIMHRELTVRENIAYSARIRLHSSWTNEQVRSHVDSIIDALGLSAVADNLIGDEISRGISGGQRKRVNIGLELAAAPIAIFLDEPTSGLDSTSAMQVCHLLRSLASLNITVVMVVHQPRQSIFESLDELLLLLPGGKTAYLGAAKNAVPYFESLGYQIDSRQNPADVLMDILAGKKQPMKGRMTIQDLADRWEKRSSTAATCVSVPITTSNAVDDHAHANGTPSIHTSSIEVSLDNEKRLGEENAILMGSDSTTIIVPVKSSVIAKMSSANIGSSSSVQAMRMRAAERGAPFWLQLILAHNRGIVQQYRAPFSLCMEIFTVSLAGLIIGFSIPSTLYQGVLISPFTLLSASPIESMVPLIGLLMGFSIALSGSSAGVNVFGGDERIIYWREAAAGHNKHAYYIGKVLSSCYRFCLSSLHFVSLFMTLANVNISFGKFYLIIFGAYFNVYGLAGSVALSTRQENSTLLAAVISLFSAVFCGYGPSVNDARSIGIEFILAMSFNRWGTEALYSEEVNFYRGVYDVDLSASFWGYELGAYSKDMAIMFSIGIIWRIFGYLLMLFKDRSKQR